MADLLTVSKGWLWLNDGSDHLKVYFQRALVKFVIKPLMLEHYEGGFNFGVGGGVQYLIFTIQNVLIPSHADFTIFVDNLKDWQVAGTFNLEIIRNTSDAKVEWDGDNTSFTVMLKTDIDQMEKISPEDGDVYRIGKLVFEEAG